MQTIIQQWKSAGAYVPGLSHIRNNKPCQDRVYTLTHKGVTAIALADGAGSREHSDLGAEVAIRTAVDKLTGDFEYLYGQETAQTILMCEVRNELHNTARENGIEFADLASTLLFVAVSGNKFIAGHLGDGIIGYTGNEGTRVLSHPDNGEYANATFFTTTENADRHLRIIKGELGGKSGFILMSDGAGDSLYDKQNKKMAPAVDALFDWLLHYPTSKVTAALHKNLESVIRQRSRAGDDCSIALLRLSEFTLDSLKQASPGKQMLVLEVPDSIALENRLKVLKFFLEPVRKV